MISQKQREKLREDLLKVRYIHPKKCLEKCVCGRDELLWSIDEYTELVTAERVRFAEIKADNYAKILQRMGANTCETCKDFMAEADEVYCDGCDNVIHQKCAGYTTKGGYYDDEGTVLCVDCKKKEDAREKEEPIEMDPWGSYDELPF